MTLEEIIERAIEGEWYGGYLIRKRGVAACRRAVRESLELAAQIADDNYGDKGRAIRALAVTLKET
jgi:hypothetical protein